LFSEGKSLRKALILGYNDIAEELIQKLIQTQESGYQIVGILDDHVNVGKRLHSALVLGKVTDLERKLQAFDIDVVMIALPASDYENLGIILQICERAGVKSQIVPYYYRYIPARAYMDDLNGLPIIDTRHVPLDNFIKALLKRAFDIAFSILAIALTSPIMLFSVLAIRMSSPGPIFYKQTRVGLNRKNFEMYKFRSMVVQPVAQERKQWTRPDDPRRTRWGEIMRKTSIDELPQFFNVLRGDMSVVGPRPERPYFVEQFKEKIPKYMIKHQVRPGITGWAQINGWRGDTSIEKRIEFDLYYIENWTFGLDLKIILLTVFKALGDQNAY
jgi:Undecaprenyl-phosphate glucose phosphotransferase